LLLVVAAVDRAGLAAVAQVALEHLLALLVVAHLLKQH